MTLIREIVQIFNNYRFDTNVLVASVRHPMHVVDAGKIGAHVVTLPPDILGKMMAHPLTDKGLAAFLSDWEKVKRDNPNLSF
jgi:transaldolase